ncbi:MAG: hypothetical protein GY757_38590, partial [bacterium]|nr:hypothetical protein [bacterium]
GFPQAILKEDPSVLDKQHGFIKRFTQKINKAMDMIALLDDDHKKLKEGTDREKADLCAKSIRPHIEETAALVSQIEERVDHKVWELPRITDILFR